MQSAPSLKVDVRVFPPFGKRVSKAWLRRIVEHSLEACDVTPPPAINVVIADDETVRHLNREYLSLDKTTDVLAFPLSAAQGDKSLPQGTFLLPPEEETPIGEIVISYPQAVRQAREGKRPLKAEMALLVVHGVLHLLGYDHADLEQEGLMWAKQEEILTGFPLD